MTESYKSYTILLNEELMSVFEATSWTDAVALKDLAQRMYNSTHGGDVVFHVRESTRSGSMKRIDSCRTKLTVLDETQPTSSQIATGSISSLRHHLPS